MDTQAQVRTDKRVPEAVPQPFVGGMQAWDRFTGEGPWVLEHPTGAFFYASLKHPDGGREHQREFIEHAWVVQTPKGTEIVPETRLVAAPPKPLPGARLLPAIAILAAAAACAAPFLALFR